MSDPSLEVLTVDELRAACAPGSLERAADRAGCGLSLVIAALAVGAMVFFAGNAGLAIGGPLFCVVGVGSYLAGARLAGARRRPFRDELRRRFGLAPALERLEQARAALRDDPALDSVVLCSVAALPHGERFAAIVEVRGNAVRSTVKATALPAASQRIEDAACTERIVEASPEDATRIVAAIARAMREGLAALPTTVHDGAPCDLMLVRRGAEPLAGSCNLAHFNSDAERATATVALALLVAPSSANDDDTANTDA